MSNEPSKLAGPLQQKIGDGGGQTRQADPGEILELYVRAEPGQTSRAVSAIEGMGLDVRSEDAGYIAVDVPTQSVPALARESAVRHVQERRTPRLHQVADKNISEGVGEMNADTLHNNGVTGNGARIAVIDHYFHTDNPKYSDRIVATVGDSTYFTSDAEYNGDRQHGTACAEIVADVAPDAELILATTRGSKSFSEILTEIESYNPDGATMSLGFYTGLRIDGQDPISSRINQFTNGGRLFANSAGNEANGGHWDGAFTDNGSGLMEFDSSLSTPTRFPVDMNPQNFSAFIHVHWDADWAQDNQRYKARLYENESDPVGDSSALVVSQTTDPVEAVSLSPSQHNSSSFETYYLEIEKVDATGDEHFDLFTWGRVNPLDNSTPNRSLGIPATSTDPDLLAVGAVQATATGRTSENHLKPYSSRGPTQDGRRGLDIAAPSLVSTTDVGAYGGYGAIEDRTFFAFNGTSAASPHIGGAFGLLFGNAVDATPADAKQALFDTGRSIPDGDIAAPGENNTAIGWGYADARAAKYTFDALEQLWTSNDLGGDPQYNTPAVYSGQVFVGGLQNAFYALSRNDGTSIGWSLDRGNKAGLSDSSAAIWTEPSQPVAFFGSGQGDLYAVETDDATAHWSDQDIPNVGSAITCTPAISNGTVFAGTNDGRVFAWKAKDATKQWEQPVDGPVYSDLAAGGGLVYVTTANGTLHVLDAADGTEQWKETSFADFGSSSPTLANGNVYVVADEGYVYDAAATKSQLDATSGFGGTAGSDPVVSNGSVYTGSADGRLYAYSNADGSEQWTFPTGDAIAATPAVDQSNDRIAVPSTDGTLYLLDTAGTQVDTVSIPSGTRASPVIDNGEVFLPTADGTVYAFQ